MSFKATIDPGIQAIFDAMFSYMESIQVPACNSWANLTGNGTSYGISVTASDGSQQSQTYFTPGSKVTVMPTGGNLGPRETQQFTATATDASGAEIAGASFTWSLQAGNPGSVDATGLYTAPATIPNQTTALVTAMLSDNTAWSQVMITLHP
jgi:hypothetical protein